MFHVFVSLQASFSSISPSFDYLLSQQNQQSHHYQQSPTQQQSQEQYSDFLLSPNQPQRAYLDQTHHSNSSSDTLVGIEEDSSTNLLQPPITHFKEEAPFLSESHTPTPGISEHEQDCLFETSSTEELGLLSLRSSSDPVLSANSRQASLQNIQRPQTSADLLAGVNPILPSFQETYQIKYSQLASFGLKMDEDCFNAAAQHQSVATYHHPHPHHQALHHSHGYGFPQHPESQYIQSSGSFYGQPYESHGMVRFFNSFKSFYLLNDFSLFLLFTVWSCPISRYIFLASFSYSNRLKCVIHS